MAQPRFEIVDGRSNIHGKGRFTTGWILRKTVICSEKPFFRLCATDFTFPPEAICDQRWQIWLNLPLYRPIHTTGRGADYDRFRATSLRCGTYRSSNRDQEASGVFLQAARFNSSCRPNVHAHWSQSKGRMDFIALRDIAPEEELCICYDPPTLLYSKADRQQRLLTTFGFSCNCTACAQDSPDSDRRRTDLRATMEEGVSNPSDDVQVALRYINQITGAISDLHVEQLFHYADTLHFDRHLALKQAGDNNNAMLCLLTARNLTCAMVGSDDPRVAQMTAMLSSDLRDDDSLGCRAGCC